jgi:predicted nucleic acid-binding protein
MEILGQLLVSSRVTGPRVHDARIAAICLAHGVTELWTADRDFSYFPRLRTRNPLVG